MGNSSSKDAQKGPRSGSRRQSSAHVGTPSDLAALPAQQSPADRLANHIYSSRGGGSGRGSRHDLSFLNLVGRDRNDDASSHDRPRETKQEKEARRTERERQARLKERERSMRDEGVDGGFLVTLGTYTGPEDFDKSVVRQLQIERRLAPFWTGLNDHSDSWTEAQLVAAAKGLPIPAADAVPADMKGAGYKPSETSTAIGTNLHALTVPISSRSQSYQSDASANLSASHPAFSSSGPASPISPTASSAALLRGRAKTLASLATGSRSQSTDTNLKEMQLPKDPYVNGQQLETCLYKDAIECPICFMYYPPYLNKTRCCDQPICSECFVQIRRPDPHPPEHEQPGQPRLPEEEAEMLVSEVAACPFCVTPEFGVTYDAPPFRKGLAYANQANGHPLRFPTSAMSSSSSLASAGLRRRATSLSATSSQVVTTDRVRPDWAKKLADARAHALRRSIAATALHNAAYVLGTQGEGQFRGNLAFRRRRTLFGDSPSASGSGTPHPVEGMSLALHGVAMGQADRERQDGGTDLYSERSSSRRNRVEDLEDLMMMEAIRLSLAAEEDRKRREDKDARKEEWKKAKEAKKEAKQMEKLAKRNSGQIGSLYRADTDESSSTWASTSMARSSSALGSTLEIPEEETQGKGKAPVQDFNPLSESTSTLNTTSSPPASGSSPIDFPQRHLEESRAHLQPNTSSSICTPGAGATHFRHLSNTSSAASSFVDSAPGSLRADSQPPSGNISGVDVTTGASEATTPHAGTPAASTSNLEPMFNFRSLAAMIGDDASSEDDKVRDGEHIEHATTVTQPACKAEEELKEPSPAGSPRVAPVVVSGEGNRSRGDSGGSAGSVPPPIYVEHPPPLDVEAESRERDQILPAPRPKVHHDDKKEVGVVDLLDQAPAHLATH